MKRSLPDKSRRYGIAVGSATEAAAMLGVCLRRKRDTHERGKQLLERMAAMLVELCRAPRED